jgi:regulator of CtrA degradation
MHAGVGLKSMVQYQGGILQGIGVLDGASAETQFFSKTFDETVALLVAARDYITYARPAEAQGFDATDQLRVNCETMRLTARLSEIMAWLLAQKAVYAGEISRADMASDKFRLSGDAVCFEETDVTVEKLPQGLRELLGRSRRLYIRVARLDELVRRSLH